LADLIQKGGITTRRKWDFLPQKAAALSSIADYCDDLAPVAIDRLERPQAAQARSG
jgi:hypothetical protein